MRFAMARGYCCYSGDCTDPLTTAFTDAEYCTCDGRTIAPGPREPYAQLGTCVGAALGVSCAQHAECSSGHCVDGVCCDGAWGAECMACNLLEGHVEQMHVDAAGEAVLAYPGHAPGLGLAVAWYGPNCEVRRLRRFDNDRGLAVQALSADSSGDVYVAGWFFGAFDLGGGPLSMPDVRATSYVARFDSEGIHRSSFGFAGVQQGTSQLDIAGLVAAGDGDVVVGGTVGRPIDFGLGPLQPDRLGSIYVVRFDPEGQARYARLVGERARLLAITGSHSGVVIAGAFSDRIEVGDFTLTSTGRGAFLAGSLGDCATSQRVRLTP